MLSPAEKLLLSKALLFLTVFDPAAPLLDLVPDNSDDDGNRLDELPNPVKATLVAAADAMTLFSGSWFKSNLFLGTGSSLVGLLVVVELFVPRVEPWLDDDSEAPCMGSIESEGCSR